MTMVGTLPKTKLSDVNTDDLFRASYKGECVTLSPAMTLQELHDQIEKLNGMTMRIATERARREAMRT